MMQTGPLLALARSGANPRWGETTKQTRKSDVPLPLAPKFPWKGQRVASALPHSLSDAPCVEPNNPNAFKFGLPVQVFEKADAPEGKQRRIGGICTTDSLDRQGERILQDGLEWEDFFESGWFNDNHSNKTTDVLGYGDPASLFKFKQGDVLPNGMQATANGTWVEGWLVNRPAANDIWDLAQALQGTGRSLGFSVEGNIVKRTGPQNKTIAKAKIRNVALTAAPVNKEARLELLARSMQAIEDEANEESVKALTGGDSLPVLNQPETGLGAGAVIRKECIEKDVANTAGPHKKRRKKKARKSLSASQAIVHLRNRVAGLSKSQALFILALTKSGEGSRGGNVIGRTKSGHAVYAHGLGVHEYTHHDFNEAAGVHLKTAHRILGALKQSSGTPGDVGRAHADAAKHIRISNDFRARGDSMSRKSLSDAQAIAYLQARSPGLSKSNARQTIHLARALHIAKRK